MESLHLPPRSRIASMDVDCQNTFTPVCPEELPVVGGTEIAPELNHQAKLAAYRIGSKDAHPSNAKWVADDDHPPLSPISGENMDLRWPVHGVPGTRGFELIAGLPKITDYDFFVWKGIEPDMHPYGNCYHDFAERLSTGLIEFLTFKGVKLVLLGGLATDYCVKTTVLQLLDAGFAVILNLGACRGIAEDTVSQAISDMKAAGGQIVQSVNQLIPAD